MGTDVIAIFDLVRLDKQFLLFDKEYQVVYSRSYPGARTTDEDGDECEDLQQLSSWVRNTFDEALRDPSFSIQAVNFAAYGASFVHLDAAGSPVGPLYSYLKPYPEELLDRFYQQNGGRDALALETASPPLGMLNSGLQLYWLKYRRPRQFAFVKRSLHLPQYISYLITGRRFSEITSIGCHTDLWNFRENAYHRWVTEEGLDRLFAPITPSNAYVRLSGGSRLVAGVGMHDSSAALVPYLLNEEKPFLLLSTGTWSIAFNAFSKELLTLEDLQKDCLYYLNFLGKPVKACRLFLGNELHHQVKKIAAHFHKEGDYHLQVLFDKELVKKLLRERDPRKQFIPETMDISGLLPRLRKRPVQLELFASFEEAYHQLHLDLVALQALSLQVVMGKTPVETLYISGSFCDNPLFVKLVASRFPRLRVYTSVISRASALGAAAVVHLHWNGDQPFPGTGKTKRHEPEEDLDMEGYRLQQA
ncbi:FGGY family carbohydrate kinase [Paraflavisolibacter sp. H34]|uniref:FGGY-family carbohydrate kinase n=1 Tax=Huijunlia imazamoxiresistens TaxID=3127457 RepID=UPI00301915B9